MIGALRDPIRFARLGAIRRRAYAAGPHLTAWMTESAEPIALSDLDVDAMAPIAPGHRWGRKLACSWLRLTGVVPDDMANPVILVRNTGEGLVQDRSGREIQAITDVWALGDIPPASGSWRVIDQLDALGAPAIDALLDCGYNGFYMVDVGDARFEGARFADLDPVAHAYYYDYLTLLLLAGATDRPGERTRLSRALDTSFAALTEEGAASGRQALAPILAERSDEDLTLTAVGHGHLDLAWMWPIRETGRKSARTYTRALDQIARRPDYIYGTSQPQQLAWLKAERPALYARVKEQILAGRIEMQGKFWVETDTVLPGGESLIRQALYGERFEREEFGASPAFCWLPDTFGYSGALPQILRGAGMDAFSTIKLSWNKVNVFPHRTFWWEGIDGTKVLVHMPPEGDYNSHAGPGNLLAAKRRDTEPETGIALLPFGAGDGGGGPGEIHLELLERERDLAGLPKVRFGAAGDFFRELATRPIEHTHAGELYLETHQGTLTTQAKTKRMNRLAERWLHNVEFMTALRGGLGERPGPELEAAWKDILLNQFHDIIPGSSITRVNREARAAYRRVLASLRERGHALLGEPSDGAAPVFANLTSFPRAEAVRSSGRWWRVDLAPYSAGRAEEAETCSGVGHGEGTLTNGQLTLRFGPSGRIVSAIGPDGRELAGPKGLNRLMLFMDVPQIPFNAWDIDRRYRSKPHMELRATRVRSRSDGVAAERESVYLGPNVAVKQVVRLVAGSPLVTFSTTVRWQGSHRMLRADFWPEDYGDEAAFDIQFGHISRQTTERDSIEMAQFEVCGHKWAATSGPDGHGFALLNDCKYGHRAKNGLLSLNLLRAPVFPDRQADRGTHRFTYAIMPFDSLGDVVAAGYALNNPLLAAGEEFASVVSTDNPAVVVETVKRAEDGSGTVLRVYESLGAAARAKIATSLAHSGVERCDLLERPTGPGSLEVALGPFEIATLLLRD